MLKSVTQRVFQLAALQERSRAPLVLFSLAMVGFTVVSLLGLVLDSRTIMGQPAWLKPMKFGVSITMYTLSTAWLLGFVRTDRPALRRAAALIAWVTVAVFTVEIIPLTLQTLRGTMSHFNVATPFDAFLFGLMGVAITILWFANFALAIILLFQPFANPALGWSVRLGLMITLVGMAVGYLMTTPTPEQRAAWEQGAPVRVIGAHAVGVPDGGPGLPVTGWSTEGGDLRIPHFFGLHALQVIPAVGGWIARRSRLSSRQQVQLVWTASFAYLGVVLLLTWQALRGKPLLKPDALTIGAFAALAELTLLAVALIARPRLARRRAPAG